MAQIRHHERGPRPWSEGTETKVLIDEDGAGARVRFADTQGPGTIATVRLIARQGDRAGAPCCRARWAPARCTEIDGVHATLVWDGRNGAMYVKDARSILAHMELDTEEHGAIHGAMMGIRYEETEHAGTPGSTEDGTRRDAQ